MTILVLYILHVLATIWLKYCRRGVKHQSINQSMVNEPEQRENGDNSPGGVLQKALWNAHKIKDTLKCDCKISFSFQCNKWYKLMVDIIPLWKLSLLEDKEITVGNSPPKTVFMCLKSIWWGQFFYFNIFGTIHWVLLLDKKLVKYS